MTKLSACQLISGPDLADNLDQVEAFVAGVKEQGDTLVVLPECFACFGAGDKFLLSIAEHKGDGVIQQRLSDIARKYAVWLVAGTIPLKTDNPDKYSASCLVYDNAGHAVAEYQKIHLFDVNIEDNTGQYLESRYTQAGSSLSVLDTPFGKLGIAVCYDIRFAGMFEAMGQLDVLALPSAFTETTGSAHWHSLLKARAIENQCYLVAANQGGEHENGRQTYGHSCIISPWGQNLAEIAKGAGIVSAPMNPDEITKIRRAMPVRQHNKFRSYFVQPD